ncbi:hypothetical protein [Streptomyces tendae]|uniref:hypothetical protein n=1 Tax=Streptomyces tendae TaxID=1932 RepID=UPI001171C00B
MGIRMLHHRTTPARARTDGPARVPLLPVPVFARGASTGRAPVALAKLPRYAAARLRRRYGDLESGAAKPCRAPGGGRPWVDLLQGYLALVGSSLPRLRPPRVLTVFVAHDVPTARRQEPPPENFGS